MQNVPKIVRERLRAATPAVNHPDADALTAFAEHSLPTLERDVVLEHLGRCGDCREIVALALPVLEPEPVDRATKPSPSGWLTWPALRWGFVAAGVVLIASVGVLRYQAHLQSRTMSASNNAPATQAGATEARNQPLATPAPPPPSAAEQREKIQSPTASALDGADTDKTTALAKKVAPQIAPAPPAMAQQLHGGIYGSGSGRGIPGGSVGGPVMANQWQQNSVQNQAAAPMSMMMAGKQQAAAPSANPQAPAASQTAVAGGASGAATADRITEAQNAATNSMQYDAPTARPVTDELKVDKAKPLPLPAPGQIGGYVVDPTGAGVSSARVTLVPSTMGGTTTTITNSDGVWLVAGLPTGNYRVAAEKPGFTTTVKDLHYDANQPKMYKFSLSPGAVSETVMVSAQAMPVQTDTATIAGPITKDANNQIPLNGRNAIHIAALAPGSGQTVWSLNPAGGLQRSTDQGKTWLPVDVTANSALYAASRVAAETSLAKMKDAEKARKAPASPIFRALAATGADVWVGGSSGALYHSADAGNHWTRIVPAAGKELTGDIVSLEFADPQHGKLSTSAAEVWITADAGQTWQKQ